MDCAQLKEKSRKIIDRDAIRKFMLSTLLGQYKIGKPCTKEILILLLNNYISDNGTDVLTIVELKELKDQIHGNDIDPSNPTSSDEYLPTGDLIRKIIKDILGDDILPYERIVQSRIDAINAFSSRAVSQRGTTNRAIEIQTRLQQSRGKKFADILEVFRNLLGDGKYNLYKDVIRESQECINEIMKDHGYASDIYRLKADIDAIKHTLNRLIAQLNTQNKSSWVDLLFWFGVASFSGPIVGFLVGRAIDLGKVKVARALTVTDLSKRIAIAISGGSGKVKTSLEPFFESLIKQEKSLNFIKNTLNKDLTKSIPSELIKESIRKTYTKNNNSYANQTPEETLLKNIEAFCDGLVKSLGAHLYGILLLSILEHDKPDYLSPREVYNEIIKPATDIKAFDSIKTWVGEITKSFVKHSLFCGQRIKLSILSETRGRAGTVTYNIDKGSYSGFISLLQGLRLASNWSIDLSGHLTEMSQSQNNYFKSMPYYTDDIKKAYLTFCLMYIKLSDNRKIPCTGLLIEGDKYYYSLYINSLFNMPQKLDDGFSFPDSPILELCINKTMAVNNNYVPEFNIETFISVSSANLNHNLKMLGIDPNLEIGKNIINGKLSSGTISQAFSYSAKRNNLLVIN